MPDTPIPRTVVGGLAAPTVAPVAAPIIDFGDRTSRKIRRCLKRRLARQVYRHLNAAAQSNPSTA